MTSRSGEGGKEGPTRGRGLKEPPTSSEQHWVESGHMWKSKFLEFDISEIRLLKKIEISKIWNFQIKIIFLKFLNDLKFQSWNLLKFQNIKIWKFKFTFLPLFHRELRQNISLDKILLTKSVFFFLIFHMSPWFSSVKEKKPNQKIRETNSINIYGTHTLMAQIRSSRFGNFFSARLFFFIIFSF